MHAPAVWAESHDRELAFAKDKQERRHLQAVHEGVLLPSEMRPGDVEAAQATIDKLVSSVRARASAVARHTMVEGRGAVSLASLHGKDAFATDDVICRLEGLGLRYADRSTAAVHVRRVSTTFSLQDATDAHMWAAALVGSYVVILPSVTGTRRPGDEVCAIIKFQKMLGTRSHRGGLSVYVSPAFRKNNANLFAAIRNAIVATPSRECTWRLVNSTSYAADTTAIALVRKSDMGRPEILWVLAQGAPVKYDLKMSKPLPFSSHQPPTHPPASQTDTPFERSFLDARMS